MPVTVKFSEHFYDRFGHEAVDELVNFLNRMDSGYRSELEQLNERNFARFEDKLERRLAEIGARIDGVEARLDAKIDQRTGELEARMAERFGKLDAKIDSGLGALRSEITAALRTEITAARADTIKWMFFFIATAVLAILGLG